MKRKFIEIPLYRCNLEIIISNDFKAASIKYKLEIGDDDLPASMDAIAYRGENKVGMLIRDNRKEFPDVIAHEAVHLASYIFKMRSIEHDMFNEEPYTYLVGWFVQNIWEFCSKKPKKRTKKS